MKFELSQALLQEVINFLISKPYAEVFQLMQKLEAELKDQGKKEETTPES